MNRGQLEEIIIEELYKTINEMRFETDESLDEKSVPQPYDRKNRRRMSKSQISNRDKIGKKMKRNPKVVARFRKKYGDEWEDYLWASASSRALGGGFKKKGGSSSSKPKTSKPKKKSSSPAKKPRNKSDVKLNPSQKRNADAMYKQLQRLAKKDGSLNEIALKNYVDKLDEKFTVLSETHTNFDGILMKKLLHKMVEKITTTGDFQ